MELSPVFLQELQNRLKIGNRKGVHLNAIPANSRYKFDLHRLSSINPSLPNDFMQALLTQQPLKFRISWRENVPNLNALEIEEQSQLVRITRSLDNLINQTEAIESEKGINTFGFGFPILARRDFADDKVTVAPILIWSLRIKRTRELNTWEILRNEDDPIYINEVLINHLQNDAKIQIQQLSNEMLDDGLIHREELIEICYGILRSINSQVPTNLKELLTNRLNSISPIGSKAHYDKLPKNSTDSVIDFGGLFSIFEVQKQNIIEDYEALLEEQGHSLGVDDLLNHQFQSISGVETDPSQQNVLHSLESKRHVLIQGPPGTGKSQTLTAVLVNALENRKRTIVVCEKRTALEVLYEALCAKQLKHNCVLIRDIVKDRKTVVDSVRDRIDNSDYKSQVYTYSRYNIDTIVKEASVLIQTINHGHSLLGKSVLGELNWTQVVGNLLRELKSGQDVENVSINLSDLSFTPDELTSKLDLIRRGESLFREFTTLSSVPFIRREKFQGENPYKLGQSIKDDFDFYTTELSGVHKLIDANKEEYRALRISDFESSVSEFLHLINAIRAKELEFADLVQEACKRYCQLRRQEYDQVKELILAHIDKIEKFSGDITNAENSLPKRRNSGLFMYLKLLFSSDYRRNERLRRSLGTEWTQLKKLVSRSEHLKSLQISFNSEDVFLSARSLMELINVEDERFDLKMQQEFNGFGLNYDLAVEDSGFQKIKTYVDQSNSLRSSNLVDILQGIEDSVQDVKALLQRLYHALEAHSDIAVNYKLEGTLNENKRNLNEIERLLENKRLEIPKQIDHECQNLDLLKSHSSGFVLTSLPKLHQKVSALVARFRSDGWTSFEIKSEDIHEIIADFTKQIECKNTYFNSRDNRFIIEYRWFHYYNNLSEVDRELVGQLKRSNNWRSSFLISYLNNLLLRNSTMELPVDDRDHFILRDKLTSLGNEQLKFIKQFWFSKQIDAARDFVRKNQGITIENLYNKRSSRNFRRLSLRQIVRKDPNLFTTFFPIVLTTPDVASNLFKGHNRFFDIVMFDEASQLRLEDNLPALLKGKQVIIAGDEHQMPPSNYFSKVFDGSIEDEDQMEEEEIENNAAVGKHEFLLSCESLLEFGNELNFQKTFLDFHYRSRHPFLIDFSNSAFYNQRLKPLPNNLEYTSINYIQVNGTFSEHTNEAEANMVIHILENVIRRFPNGNYPTVGVATFNIAQRNLIKSKIADKIIQERTGSFGDKIRELEEAGLFVKNLENIQGDERDVIILSTTYGIGKDGKFAQRFGPINHSKGYRLLNVIITRAKYKVYCCTSIPEKYFVHYKDFLVTEGANNRRAVLYAYLAYCKAVSEGNLTERTAILEALSDNSDSESEFNPALFGELESPFEEEVYEAIVDHLGSEHIIPQMRFAGFRIDLVYESPILGVPKIAIECDGAKYHSSREAYVYDTHRQKILEGHGFVFHRIWSTNWWRDAKRETEQLIDFIRKVEGNPRVDTHKHDLKALAFADVDVAINRQFNVKAEIDLIADLSIIKSFQSAETDQLVKSEATVVKVDSIVHVKYMNNGKELAVHLVPTENNKIIKGQPQKVFYKSALAVSLIGATVGDVVKVGSLDNFVQIIGIDN